jgi:hypothetical protein
MGKHGEEWLRRHGRDPDTGQRLWARLSSNDNAVISAAVRGKSVDDLQPGDPSAPGTADTAGRTREGLDEKSLARIAAAIADIASAPRTDQSHEEVTPANIAQALELRGLRPPGLEDRAWLGVVIQTARRFHLLEGAPALSIQSAAGYFSINGGPPQDLPFNPIRHNEIVAELTSRGEYRAPARSMSAMFGSGIAGPRVADAGAEPGQLAAGAEESLMTPSEKNELSQLVQRGLAACNLLAMNKNPPRRLSTYLIDAQRRLDLGRKVAREFLDSLTGLILSAEASAGVMGLTRQPGTSAPFGLNSPRGG